MTQPPRVTLDLRSADFKNDPASTWRRLHDIAPVVRSRQPFLGRLALACRAEEAREVLEDESRFTVDATRVGRASRTGTAWFVPAGLRRLADNLLVYEGDAHRALRRRVDHAFRRSSLEQLQPTIERRVQACMDALASADEPCFVRDVARPLPVGVISDLLGLPTEQSAPGTPLGDALQRLSLVRGPVDLLRLGPALARIEASLREALALRRRQPRDDLLSALLDDDDGAPLDDDARVSMVFLLYVAGHETTTHLLSLSVLELLRSEVERPAAFTAPDVLELVRALGPVEMSKPRFVVQDTQLAGLELRRGTTVAALVAAADHDDRVRPRPARIDFDRPAGRLCGFGAGTHSCLGAQLAIRETCTTLDALFGRFERLALAGQPRWGSRVGLRSLKRLPLSCG